MSPVFSALTAVLGLLGTAFFGRLTVRALRPKRRGPRALTGAEEHKHPNPCKEARWLEGNGFTRLGQVRSARSSRADVFTDATGSTFAMVFDPEGQGAQPVLWFFTPLSSGRVIETSFSEYSRANESGGPRDHVEALTQHRQTTNRASERHGAPNGQPTLEFFLGLLGALEQEDRSPNRWANLGIICSQLTLLFALVTASTFFPAFTARLAVTVFCLAGGALFLLANVGGVLVHYFPWRKRIRIGAPVGDTRPGVRAVQEDFERLGFKLMGRHLESNTEEPQGMQALVHESRGVWANTCFQLRTGPFGYFLSTFPGGQVVLTWCNVFKPIEDQGFILNGAVGQDEAWALHQQTLEQVAARWGAPVPGRSLADREAAARQYYRATISLRGARSTWWSVLFFTFGACQLVLGLGVLALS
jgi:hypothetical protein